MHDLVWTEQSPGSRYALLNTTANGGVTTLTQFDAGAIGGWHSHPGGEELYVVSGALRVDGHELHAGDYLCTPVDRRHRVEAIEDTLLLVLLPKLPVYE
jgi:quercetin dioxygenase-like cupin family protein